MKSQKDLQRMQKKRKKEKKKKKKKKEDEEEEEEEEEEEGRIPSTTATTYLCNQISSSWQFLLESKQ